MKKKLISIILIIALALSVSIPSLAANKNRSTDRAPLEDVIAYIHSIYPDAQVVVDDNNELQILIGDQQPQTSNKSMSALASIYAPNGGSYRNYLAPPGTDPYSEFPWSKVYLPADQTVAVLSAKLNQDLFEDVIDLAAGGISLSAIAAWVYSAYGIWLGPAGVSILIGIGIYNVMDWIDTYMLVNITNNYSRISIERSTTMGWPSNYYSGWVGNYVSATPYESWGPVFYSGAYDI